MYILLLAVLANIQIVFGNGLLEEEHANLQVLQHHIATPSLDLLVNGPLSVIKDISSKVFQWKLENGRKQEDEMLQLNPFFEAYFSNKKWVPSWLLSSKNAVLSNPTFAPYIISSLPWIKKSKPYSNWLIDGFKSIEDELDRFSNDDDAAANEPDQTEEEPANEEISAENVIKDELDELVEDENLSSDSSENTMTTTTDNNSQPLQEEKKDVNPTAELDKSSTAKSSSISSENSATDSTIITSTTYTTGNDDAITERSTVSVTESLISTNTERSRVTQGEDNLTENLTTSSFVVTSPVANSTQKYATDVMSSSEQSPNEEAVRKMNKEPQKPVITHSPEPTIYRHPVNFIPQRHTPLEYSRNHGSIARPYPTNRAHRPNEMLEDNIETLPRDQERHDNLDEEQDELFEEPRRRPGKILNRLGIFKGTKRDNINQFA